MPVATLSEGPGARVTIHPDPRGNQRRKNIMSDIIKQYEKYVMPTYGRISAVIVKGEVRYERQMR